MGKFLFRLNKVVLFKIIILLLFATLFLVFSANGKAKVYVHPKLIPFIVVCAIAFIAISLILFKELFKSARKSRIQYSMLLFIAPLLMGFLIPAKPVTNSFTPLQTPKLFSQSSVNNSNFIQGDSSSTSNQKEDSSSSVEYNDGSGAKNEDSELDLNAKKIVIDDDNIMQWVQEIYTNLPKHEGKEIELIGFVYRDKNYKNDEFVVARALMACCAADTQVIGFMSKYKPVDPIINDTWFKVTGIIKSDTYEDRLIPMIEISSMLPVLKPENEYIYPY